jgi:hypothetical protein
VAAPTMAGYLVQWFTGAGGVLADAASYLWSALWLRSIHAEEKSPPRTDTSRMRTQIRDGLRLVTGDPILRALAGNTATFCLAQAIYVAIIVVFLVRVVHLSAAAIGLLNTVGLAGAVWLTWSGCAPRCGRPRSWWRHRRSGSSCRPYAGCATCRRTPGIRWPPEAYRWWGSGLPASWVPRPRFTVSSRTNPATKKTTSEMIALR